MTKTQILKEIAAATKSGDVEEILTLTKLLENTTDEVPKKKRGRPKKSEQKSVRVIQPKDTEDESEDDEYDPEIEDDDDDEMVIPKSKKIKKDPLVESFKVEHKPPFKENIGIRLSWKKPEQIQFLDEKDMYLDDIEIDKKLKVQENVPRREAVKKVKVKCSVCDKKVSVYNNNLHYYFDDQERKTMMVPYRCDQCFGGR